MYKTLFNTKSINNSSNIKELNCNHKNYNSKRVNIVTIKMIKENSILYKNRQISSPQEAVNLVRDFLENSDREQLIVCCLDTKNQPTIINTVSIGSLNSSIVHPREVFKTAILGNSASIIIFHNHPSGDPTPSKEDVNITKRLSESGKILGINLIDHIILGDKNYISLKDKCLL
jgi:DNA repair protein RadC